ncbi:MAG: 7-cyano-7-deazaguanine synthase [Pirellulales bacterium]|jgi:7-cyano-7-deazaguanine synthase
MGKELNGAPIGLLLSGGLDSSILLGHLVEQGYRVQPFYVRSELTWQGEELLSLRRFLRAVSSWPVESLVILDLPLTDLYGDHWSVTGNGTPAANTPDDAVYLPGRNALLAIKPALWCQMHGIGQLALGALGSNPFSDATDEFFARFEAALNLATACDVRIVRPFGDFDKQRVMQLGRDYPLELTFSCIAPVAGLHCGRCNKCAERKAAFALVAAADPTRYASTVRQPSPTASWSDRGDAHVSGLS